MFILVMYAFAMMFVRDCFLTNASSHAFCQSSVWLYGAIMKVPELQILFSCVKWWCEYWSSSSPPPHQALHYLSYKPIEQCCFLFSKRWSWMHNAFYLFLSLFSLPRVFPAYFLFISTFPISGDCSERCHGERSQQLCLVTELSTFLQMEADWPLPSRYRPRETCS